MILKIIAAVFLGLAALCSGGMATFTSFVVAGLDDNDKARDHLRSLTAALYLCCVWCTVLLLSLATS